MAEIPPAPAPAPARSPVRPEHGQAAYRVRFDWGPTGAQAIAAGADVAVVVDVLSFTTALSIAADVGTTVLPYPWTDGATEHARANGTVLARRRSDGGEGPSLSPASLRAPVAGGRLVLPSPNGSAIAFALKDARAVLGSSLRTAELTARWILAWTPPDAVVAVVAAGERWPDGSLRPAVEDLWGAGAVIEALRARGRVDLSPEAVVAADAYRAVDGRVRESLLACAGGRELVAAGYPQDVEVAAELDAGTRLPVLRGHAFVGEVP